MFVSHPLMSIDFSSMFIDSLFQMKKEDFFEEGPTQFSDLKFTDMNLSRPILKVGYVQYSI